MIRIFKNQRIMRISAYIFIVVFLILQTNCTLDRVSGSNANTLTEEDLEAATLILGESISSNNSGVYLSVQDLLAIISESGYTPKINPSSLNKYKYDQITNYRSRYNQDTGVHTVTFQRSDEQRLKSESDSLRYIYRDQNEDYVAFPREQQSLIETINYSGIKEGTIRDAGKTSTFVRENEFFISNLTSAEEILSLEGIHLGNGFINIENADGQSLQRYYELSFTFLNTQIERMLNDRNQIIDFSIIGGLNWEIESWNTPEKLTESTIMSGTQSFVGDGTVIVRFNGADTTLLLDVETGQQINAK
jgi:hypothetical protein